MDGNEKMFSRMYENATTKFDVLSFLSSISENENDIYSLSRDVTCIESTHENYGIMDRAMSDCEMNTRRYGNAGEVCVSSNLSELVVMRADMNRVQTRREERHRERRDLEEIVGKDEVSSEQRKCVEMEVNGWRDLVAEGKMSEVENGEKMCNLICEEII